MESFGKDLDCVTQISLDSLKEIKEKLLKIEIVVDLFLKMVIMMRQDLI